MIQVNVILLAYCILGNTLIFVSQFHTVLGQFRVKKPPCITKISLKNVKIVALKIML